MTLVVLTPWGLPPRDFLPIPPTIMMAHLIIEMMLVGRGRCYPVIAGDELLGLVTLTDAQQLGREHWPTTSVYNAMTPFEKLGTVSPQKGAGAGPRPPPALHQPVRCLHGPVAVLALEIHFPCKIVELDAILGRRVMRSAATTTTLLSGAASTCSNRRFTSRKWPR